MKKIAIAVLAATALLFGVAAPVQADAADRKLVKSVTITVFYDQTYDEQDTLCWGWRNFPSMTLTEIGKGFAGMGISRTDIRTGIRQAFNAVC